MDGKVPGLSADASAALGYLFFFGLWLPVCLIAIGTFVLSLLAREKWLSALAGLLLATTVLAITNVWAGVLASLTYLSLSIWSLVQRLRQRVQPAIQPPREGA